MHHTNSLMHHTHTLLLLFLICCCTVPRSPNPFYVLIPQTSYVACSGMMLSDRSAIWGFTQFLLRPRSPRMATSVLLNNANRMLVRIKPITWLYSSPFFLENSSAMRLWYLVDSGPIPPEVENTRGEKDPFSNVRFFSASCWMYSWSIGFSM